MGREQRVRKGTKANPVEQDQPHGQLLLEAMLFIIIIMVKVFSLSVPSLIPFFTSPPLETESHCVVQSGFKFTFFRLQHL